jgi:hypothetical protein
MDASGARKVVSGHLILHVGHMICAGHPHPAVFGGREWWLVPLVYSSPGTGPIGDVGVAVVDPAKGEMVFCSPLHEIHKYAKEIIERHRDYIEESFRKITSSPGQLK